MKVHQLIKLLQEFEDQDAEVEVIEHSDVSGYYEQGGRCKEVAFNKDEHFEYTDMRGNKFVKPESKHFNRRTLLLGAMGV